MNGIQLCSRFSYEPCHLCYCGPKEAPAVLQAFLKDESTEDKAAAQLKRFEGLYPYLELIARKNRKRPFDHDVVEAYWLGNELLSKVYAPDIRKLISETFSKYLTPTVAERLAEKVPNGSKAHHSFHVFHILNVQSLTGRVPPNLATMDSCFVNPCRVLEAKEKYLFVEGLKLTEAGLESDHRWQVKMPSWLEPVRRGDWVAVHWNKACLKITEHKAQELSLLTKTQSELLL